MDFKLDDIRDTYKYNETCQGTVPQAIEAFLESKSFEDAIRNAISIGGDSDTLAAITGGFWSTKLNTFFFCYSNTFCLSLFNINPFVFSNKTKYL